MWVAAFPGQGSQYIGIGKTLYAHFPFFRQMVEEAQDIFKKSFVDVFFGECADTLNQTQNAQIAIFLKSFGLWRLLMEEKELKPQHFSAIAGHSLGEYTALCAAGTLSFSQTLHLLKARIAHMTQKAPPGMMAAVLGLTKEQVSAYTKDLPDCFLANDNSPKQIILSGTTHDVQACLDKIKAEGVRTVVLKVTGPFHTPLMAQAQEAFGQELEKVQFKKPSIPVISNTTGQTTVDPNILKFNLSRHMTHPVLWQDTQKELVQCGQNFIEIGPGKVLQGLAKQTIPQMHVFGLSKMEGFQDPMNASFFAHLAHTARGTL